MARTVRDSKLDSRAARLRMSVRHEPYWRAIDGGMHLGYRKGQRKASWLARFRTSDGKYLKTVLDGMPDDNQDANGKGILSYSQAQARAREWFAKKAKAERRDDGEPDETMTVADAMRGYLAWYASHKKSLRDVDLRTKAFILPKLGDIRVRDLTTRKVRDWHVALTKQPPRLRTGPGRTQQYREARKDPDYLRSRRASANHVLTILKAALNQAWQDGAIESDEAWRRVKPFKDVDAPRVRYISVVESRRLLNACAPDFRKLVRGALLTGCRYGELTMMRCTDFNADAQSVHVRVSKSGKPRSVPLTDEGIKVFADLTAGRNGDDPIFLREDGERWGKSHQRRRLDDATAVVKLSGVSFHILRHSYASLLAMNGTPMRVIAEVLGHADTRICEKHYAHLAPSYVADTIRARLPMISVSAESKLVQLAEGRPR